MYVPKAYQNDDREALVAFMRGHSFATLVSVVDGAPCASHIPLVVTTDGDAITLTGHVARANPQWAAFGAAESVAIFTGPHAYVSPSLYDERESVPTWNYIAVHAYGRPAAVRYADSPAAVERMLEAMIGAYEPAYQAQWRDLSAKYREGMMRGIVGFEMAVTRLEGKYKLSQKRSAADQERVAEALGRSADPAAQATGAAMLSQLAAAAEH